MSIDEACNSKHSESTLGYYGEAAASEGELPSARMCVKLASAALSANKFSEAAEWCKRVVDAGGSYSDWVAASNVLRMCPPENVAARRSNLRVALVSTWTTKTFAPLLELAAARCGMKIEIWEAEFGQYFNEVFASTSNLFSASPDVIVLMPDARALGFTPDSAHDPARTEEEIARWTSAVDAILSNSQAALVQQGIATRPNDVFGNLSFSLAGSITSQTQQLNLTLAIDAQTRDYAYVDVENLSAGHGKCSWFDDRSWYLAKIPYSPAALCRLAHETAVVLSAQLGLSRRCLVVDLDNTIWGGVIGDDGLEGIQLGSGIEGEAFVDFQRALKSLTTRGVVLAACSKNNPETARLPFREHPDMVLSLDDFAVFVANWDTKSENLLKISEALSLGLESITFFDDNPYEREEVRRRLPDVDIPILPQDPSQYRACLEAYRYFELGKFTSDDANRNEAYRARAKATELQANSTSLEDYQKSLAMAAQIGPVDSRNISRVVQLINKTNQYNLTHRRRNRIELENFISKDSAVHFWLRLQDRFADHGLVAVFLGVQRENLLEIDTLLMSCRVIGRGVEDVMINEIARIAALRNCREVRGIYTVKSQNSIVSDLYDRMGFLRDTIETGTSELYYSASPESLHRKPLISVEYAHT